MTIIILKYIAKVKFILMIGILSIFGGCNDTDDIKAIFMGQTWYLGDFYTTTNWKDDNNYKIAMNTYDENKKNIIRDFGKERFYISFQEETFTAKGLNNTFSGTWSADGKSNTISFLINNGSTPSGSGLAEQISKKFYESIKNAEFYRGNTIWIKIYPHDKKSFIQLTKNRK